MLKKVLLAITSVIALSLPSGADDGYIYTGGNPHLMTGHSTVSMESETVNVDISDNLVTVDCQFIFKNDGEACSVRMGFPDMSTNSDTSAPQGSFRTYKSYVEGKEVDTQTVNGDKHAGSEGIWHAKIVNFPAHSLVHVRDQYSDIESALQVRPDGGVNLFVYILHTASSWKGAIKSGDVNIVFHRPLPPIHLSAQTANSYDRKFWLKAPTGTISYLGPCPPTVAGNTLNFHFENLRPSKQS